MSTEAAIGELVTAVGGGTPRRTVREYYGGSIPWVTPKDMKQSLISSSEICLTEAGIGNSPARLVPAGSVLVVVRSGVLKHTLPVALTKVPVTVNQDMKALVPTSAVFAPYLARLVKALQPTVLGWVRATTADNFPIKNLLDLRVNLPSLDEQRRIAALLDHVEGLRLQSSRVIAEIDQLEQATFIDIFGEPISNPHGYPLERLGAVGKLDRGVSKHRPRNDPQLLGGPYPLIQTGDVARSKGIISTYTTTYSEAGLAQSKLWPAGTLCITIAANIAQTGVLAFEACFPDSVVGFTADEATTAYVRTWLTFLQETLEAAAPQSAQRNINLAILRDLPIPLPPLADRKRFSECLGAIKELREQAVRRGQQLDELFASTRYGAFRAAVR